MDQFIEISNVTISLEEGQPPIALDLSMRISAQGGYFAQSNRSNDVVDVQAMIRNIQKEINCAESPLLEQCIQRAITTCFDSDNRIAHVDAKVAQKDPTTAASISLRYTTTRNEWMEMMGLRQGMHIYSRFRPA